jgi:hypothetical protein
MFVKPALVDATRHPGLFAELAEHERGRAGLSVRDPDLKDLLPREGREVPSTDYWHRRLRDGDVVLAPAPTATEETGA